VTEPVEPTTECMRNQYADPCLCGAMSNEPCEAQRLAEPTTSFYPQEGAFYRHYKGGLYQVLMVVLRESDAANMVVYQAQDGTIPWVRPLTEFAENFSYVSNVGWEPA
jgi:hypothetical protein